MSSNRSLFRGFKQSWISMLINTTKRRVQTHKILPHGPPDDIDENAHRYNALNFKIPIDPEADYVKEAERSYAPRTIQSLNQYLEFDYWAVHTIFRLAHPLSQAIMFGMLEDLQLEGFYDDREECLKEVQNALQVNIRTMVDDLQALQYDEEGAYMGGVKGGLGPELRDANLAEGMVNFSSDDEDYDVDND
ncbi:hypothetical protein K435DRAFT_866827 [Dendrothele bispora CBS 962.96]|uniref:Uncharacterized protein n=1 Tax=Dendrothele bispora (strain CBS 962.96) TaxID=1314807 RepID=A0A4S8LH46_DENBC|nr:hypothetical protein K435DRAFT_866827 [Dendrothele bispora CBS 962.96]